MLAVCRGEGNGGRTLVEEAVELELLDPFGGCCVCHCEIFLYAFLSCFCPTSFV